MFKELLDFITPTRTEVSTHVHEWGPWKEYGFSWQQRQCKTCGWQQRTEINESA